jgi:hypothetical protein
MEYHKNRRRCVRYPGSFPAHYRVYSRYAESKRTVLKDLSQDGFGLLSGEWLRPNAIIGLTVDVQGECHRLFGRVIWCNRRESAYDVGARFLNTEDPARGDVIEQLCQEMVRRQTVGGRDARATGYGADDQQCKAAEKGPRSLRPAP